MPTTRSTRLTCTSTPSQPSTRNTTPTGTWASSRDSGGRWLWSNQYGYEVLQQGQPQAHLYSVNENREVTSRPAQGHWVGQEWVEDGSQVHYAAVQGPVNFVNVDGQPFPLGHVRIDQHGRRTVLDANGTWFNIDTVVPYTADQDDGTGNHTHPAAAAALNDDDDGAVSEVSEILQEVYGREREPPRPERVEGAVAGPPLVPSPSRSPNQGSPNQGSSSQGPGPGPYLDISNPTWGPVDGWLAEVFPLSRYRAADSLEARMQHHQAYLPREKPPQLTFARDQNEASDVWVSVRSEVDIPCTWHDSQGSNSTMRFGKKPFPVPSPYFPTTPAGSGWTSGPPDANCTAIALVEALHSQMLSIGDALVRRRRQRPYFASTKDRLSQEARQRNPARRLTDDEERWYWQVEPLGFSNTRGDQDAPLRSADIKMYKVAITTPAYLYNEQTQHSWFWEPQEMFSSLDRQFPWWADGVPSMQVEVGPLRGLHWSTPQLRNIASFWYACEPYLQSLLPDIQEEGGRFEPTHGRCRVAQGEPPETSNWLCRQALHGAKFSALPLEASLRVPEPTQTEHDLAEHGPDRAGEYDTEARSTKRGSTVLHNGISPAGTFFSRQPTDWEGNPTGQRPNLWRLRRHDVLNNIQRAASSPAVALMIPKRSLYVTMAPSTLKGVGVGGWGTIVANLVRIAASSADWPQLCRLMPPAYELVRSAEPDERDPATGMPRFPHGMETRYSAKFDVFDMMWPMFPAKLIGIIESLMHTGMSGDGHIFGHRSKSLG
ncbi:hypothetical protein PG996_012171 [Apiospora saccharicola]|uniref:Uncharacterized protein n=1 Tax=Apiospora saccharicola TaxID=335842 RepID=A0ABR1U1U7_9PEZI